MRQREWEGERERGGDMKAERRGREIDRERRRERKRERGERVR